MVTDEDIDKYKNDPLSFIMDFCGVDVLPGHVELIRTLEKHRIEGKKTYFNMCAPSITRQLINAFDKYKEMMNDKL